MHVMLSFYRLVKELYLPVGQQSLNSLEEGQCLRATTCRPICRANELH